MKVNQDPGLRNLIDVQTSDMKIISMMVYKINSRENPISMLVYKRNSSDKSISMLVYERNSNVETYIYVGI